MLIYHIIIILETFEDAAIIFCFSLQYHFRYSFEKSVSKFIPKTFYEIGSVVQSGDKIDSDLPLL